jgi:putative ABC transport system permease protein
LDVFGWVINQAAASLLGRDVQLGEALSVAVGDTHLLGRLVGRIEEPVSPPTVYRLAPADAPSTHWRLALRPGSDAQAVAKRLAAAASGAGLAGLRAVTERDLRPAAAGHLLVLERTLAWVALGTGLVGLVALGSALDSGVAERRRELLVLRALGAPDRLLALTVMGEALLVVAISLAVAMALGLWLDPQLAARLGQISGQPLRAQTALLALPLWSLLALAGGLLASAGAARAAVQRRGASAWSSG